MQFGIISRFNCAYDLFILFFSSSSSLFAGYETVIGYLDVKTSSGVSFYVQRQTTYNTTGTVITYEVTRLNIGGAMNAATGVFTAPVNGRYHFSFTALSISSTAPENTSVHLRVNGVFIGESWVPSDRSSMPLVATLQLKTGDTIDMYLGYGSIVDNVYHYTKFTGFLLEEDLLL